MNSNEDKFTCYGQNQRPRLRYDSTWSDLPGYIELLTPVAFIVPKKISLKLVPLVLSAYPVLEVGKSKKL